MKLEYKLFNRTIFKSGSTGDWFFRTASQNLMFIKAVIDADKECAKRSGTKVEHRMMVREIPEWKSVDLNEILKSKNNKEASNG